MNTIEKYVNPEKIDRKIIEEAGEIIKKGGLVAFATETVYGLGADALKEEAAKKIYQAKGRPSDNPLIVHIAEMDALGEIAASVPKKAEILAEAFWPGPLTMIFQKTDKVPAGTTGGLNTVAVRMPEHKTALALIRAGGGFIAAPSANLSGRPSPTCAAHVAEDFSGRIEMILDSGPVGIGLESTIVDMSTEPPVILRPGYITKAMLEKKIGPVETDRTVFTQAGQNAAPKAPGMKYKHYAPKADLTVVEGEQQRVISEINRIAEKKLEMGKKVGIIGTDETISAYQWGIIRSIGTRTDEETIARNLYAVLREFDHLEVDVIYSEAFDTPHMGQAIMNRLLKAAAHRKIQV